MDGSRAGRPVRVGVVGLGSVARVYVPHIRRLNLEGTPCAIAVACDLDEGRRAKAEGWGIPDFTTSWREVVARDDVDLVVVLTAMQVHGEIARAALDAGKHVLVEKPMSMDLGEAAELVAAARTAKGNLVCAPHVTLSPTFGDMWRAIRAGRIGRPTLARGFYGWSGPDWGAWFY